MYFCVHCEPRNLEYLNVVYLESNPHSVHTHAMRPMYPVHFVPVGGRVVDCRLFVLLKVQP